jgi:hypothetical protein
MRKNIYSAAFLVALFSGLAAAGTIPMSWTCTGTCGSSGANGVVTLSPFGASQYDWVSTNYGTSGVGALPTGALGSETNGSTLATSVFSATAGTALDFYFDYVTSDGARYADYAWAELFDSSNNPVALLFTARTVPSGSIVPGDGMPASAATLNPSSAPIIGGAPTWSPLGSSSGTCFGTGCGYTGWIASTYTVSSSGNYYLEFGVVNWSDESYNSGLALDGITVGGVPIDNSTPEPATPFLVATALAGLLLLGRRWLA